MLQNGMIRSFRSKALERCWTRNDASKIRPDWVKRVRSHLDRLDAAEKAESLDMAGSGFHALAGNLAGRYALTVSHNCRLTFGWDGNDALDLDLEDDHD